MSARVSLPLPKKGDFIISRDGSEKGRVCGQKRLCRQIEGCTGAQYPVRWPDKKLTWCCIKGMHETPEGWRIG